MDILFYKAFSQIDLSKDRLQKASTPLIGFFRMSFWIFLVVKVPAAYNILKRHSLNALGAMILTYHLLMQFSTPHMMGEVQDDQALARRNYMATLKSKKPKEAMSIESLDL